MRVWDLPVELLCQKHLLAQHLEIHTMYKTIQTGRKGYANHPETKRWVGRQTALKAVHDATAAEMVARGYKHLSPLPPAVKDILDQTEFVNTIPEQLELLRNKGCECVTEIQVAVV